MTDRALNETYRSHVSLKQIDTFLDTSDLEIVACGERVTIAKSHEYPCQTLHILVVAINAFDPLSGEKLVYITDGHHIYNYLP